MGATRVRNKIKRGGTIYAEEKGLGMRLRVIYKCDCAACQLRAVGLVLSMANTRATKKEEKIVATGRMCNVVTGGGGAETQVLIEMQPKRRAKTDGRCNEAPEWDGPMPKVEARG